MHQKEVLIAHSRADRVGRIRCRRAAAAHLALDVVIHLTGGLPWAQPGSRHSQGRLQGAWEALKGRTSPEELEAAYKDLNIRDDI